MDKKKRFLTGMIAVAAVVIVAGITAFLLYRNSDTARISRQLELAQRYLFEEDYEQAIAAFEGVIAIDPRNEDAYIGLTEVYIAMDDLENAARILEQAIEQIDSPEILAMLEVRTAEIEQQTAETANLASRGKSDSAANLQQSEAGQETRKTIQGATESETAADFQQSEPELENAGTIETEQIQVTIMKTDIQADGVFNNGGYGSLVLNGDYSSEDSENSILPQAALVDAGGSFVFPWIATYKRYYVSDGIVSLTEGSPYGTSAIYDEDQYPVAYYRLDGSPVFVGEETNSEVDEHTTETIQWHGGSMQDGYALVVKVVYSFWWNGGAGYNDWEYHSCIMDKNGTVTCTLSEEFNDEIAMGAGGFDTRCSLGWCGERLFAVFENSYDEDWNYSSEGKGYMDFAGKMVIDLSGYGYTNLWPFHGGLAAVRSESGKVGFIDKTGKLVIPYSYEYASGFSKDGVCGVRKDGKSGYISADGSVLIPFVYDDVYGAGDGLAAVVKDGKCGLVDYDNRVVVPLEYDDISSFEGGVAYAIKDGTLYIISG